MTAKTVTEIFNLLPEKEKLQFMRDNNLISGDKKKVVRLSSLEKLKESNLNQLVLNKIKKAMREHS